MHQLSESHRGGHRENPEAIAICMEQMCREEREEEKYSKKQAAAMAGVTPEAIRNWERNGLLGCYEPYQRRFYRQALLNRMYVIRLLLDTGYSMMTIRSFMQEYDDGQPENAEQLLINPREREELCYRSDRYLEALLHLREKALQLREMKLEMEKF